MEPTIEFFIEARIEQDGDLWSAYCDKLKLASYGTTREEAEHNLKKALEAFARARRLHGDFEDDLDNANIYWRPLLVGIKILA